MTKLENIQKELDWSDGGHAMFTSPFLCINGNVVATAESGRGPQSCRLMALWWNSGPKLLKALKSACDIVDSEYPKNDDRYLEMQKWKTLIKEVEDV